MRDIAVNLVESWIREIESIEPHRKIEGVNFFDIKGNNTSQECFKVNFNFGLSDVNTIPVSMHLDDWSDKLLSKFFGKFYHFTYNKPDNTYLNNGKNGGETIFNNDKADYMTYQGHRFIIQFYPSGFISEIRDEKLEELGI